jgi:hypothetical protein
LSTLDLGATVSYAKSVIGLAEIGREYGFICLRGDHRDYNIFCFQGDPKELSAHGLDTPGVTL